MGACIGRSKRLNLPSWAVQTFDRALPTCTELTSPRAWAFTLLGLDPFLRACPDHAEATAMRAALTEKPCGLHVIGSARHEARRIDRQLRGRCARQGDPGSSRFYVSLEDDLMRLFGSDRIANVMSRLGL